MSTLTKLAEAGVLEQLDVHFAELVDRLSGGATPSVALAAALATRAVRIGHVCLDLDAVTKEQLTNENDEAIEGLLWPDAGAWRTDLAAAPCVDSASGAKTGPLEVRPLVLDGSRLYLTRYHIYERQLVEALGNRCGKATGTAFDESRVTALFPKANGIEARQADAARTALRSRLTIISGGPGTGKTRTVARILALLQEAEGCTLRVSLAAPTGKAADRLGESIAQALADGLPVDPKVTDAIPPEATTIHRLLGYRMRTPTRFRHNADNPLRADVVVIDEASMIDVALMAKLVDAVRPDARLILLGDRDQLASVEAGVIFGDICLAGNEPHSPLRNHTVELTHRFRFAKGGSIGDLADAIRAGDADTALRLLGDKSRTDICLIDPGAGSPVNAIRDEVLAGYRAMLEAPSVEQALAHVTDYRVLCAHRRGLHGVERVGPSIERLLEDEGLISRHRRDPWYEGRLVMVTENDYSLGLFNGDVGLTWRDPASGGDLRVWLGHDPNDRVVLQPTRLPTHETCVAMTVHKSQGSEVDRVAVVLPSQPSPILTRELIYTAVTRAKSAVTVVGSAAVLAHAIGRRVTRVSGLRVALAAAMK